MKDKFERKEPKKCNLRVARVPASSGTSNSEDVRLEEGHLNSNIEDMQYALECMLGGDVGVIKLGSDFFLLYNNSEFTEGELEVNIGASWLISCFFPGDQDVKIYGNVLVLGCSSSNEHTMTDVDFDKLAGFFDASKPYAKKESSNYCSKFSIN